MFNWKNIIVALMLGALVGGAAGWKVTSWSHKADELSIVKVEQKAIIASVEKSSEIENANIAAKDGIATRFEVIKKEIRKNEKRSIEARTPNANPSLCAADTVSAGELRMLHAALTNQDPDPATIGDAESKASSAIGLSELSENIVVNAKQYHELAANHDSLVDYVAWVMAQQKQ